MICNVPVCDSDIDEPIVIVPTSNTVGKEYVGTSQTDKPTGVQQYSIYHELDTGKNYYYDNGQWNEIPCCSGGGGGGTGTMWHVVVNSVAVEGNYLNVGKAEDTDDYGTIYVALPTINDVPYSSISLATDDGIENLAIGYMVADVASDVHPIITIAYDASIAVNATGDIAVTHDEYDFICTITGDGTITITEA